MKSEALDKMEDTNPVIVSPSRKWRQLWSHTSENARTVSY